MAIHRRRADLPNLGQKFLDEDPQFADKPGRLTDVRMGPEETQEDEEPTVGLASDYGGDLLLDNRDTDDGPLDTEFLIPAPSQSAGADEEVGGMYGSTADELLGTDSQDETTLGAGGRATVMDDLHDETHRGQPIEVASGHNPLSSTGLEDQVSDDLPDGGTYGRSGPVVDPETGELSDYDD